MNPDDALLRPIQPADDESMARVLRSVMTEFGARGQGFTIDDPEVDHMSRAYGLRDFVGRGECVRVEKITEPSSRYGVFSEAENAVPVNNLFESMIDVRRFFIREIATGELVAERRNYVLYQKSLPVFSSFATGLGCPDVGVISKLPNIGDVENYIHPD